MIVDRHKLIYIHVIKTAGVSIEKYFGSNTHDHRNTKDYIELLGGQPEFKEYFSFTIVRNPWDKMVSQYAFNAHNWVTQGTSFKQYIELFGNGKKVSTYSPLHIPYLVNDENKIVVDYIGRFEALDDSMNYVCQQIGIRFEGLPHLNSSTRDDYRQYYDDESAEIVQRVFQNEINRFDYKFGD